MCKKRDYSKQRRAHRCLAHTCRGEGERTQPGYELNQGINSTKEPIQPRNELNPEMNSTKVGTNSTNIKKIFFVYISIYHFMYTVFCKFYTIYHSVKKFRNFSKIKHCQKKHSYSYFENFPLINIKFQKPRKLIIG